MKILIENRLARNSLLVVVVGILYLITVTYALTNLELATNEITNTSKLLMEGLTIISAWILFIFSVSLVIKCGIEYNSIVAMILMGLFLLTTLIVHFSSIVLTRTSLYDNELMKSILSFSWPSILFTIDILSWNMIYGIACLYVGACARKKYSNSIGILSTISGILCLIGLIALPLNNMNFRLIGVVGYSIIPVVIGILVFIKELRNEKYFLQT